MIKLFRNFLLYLYIVLAPLLNSLQDVTIGGSNIVAVVSSSLCLIGVTTSVLHFKKNNYFSFVVLLVFIYGVYRTGLGQCLIGLVILVLLYVSFLNLDSNIDVKKVFYAYYCAIMLAAFFSVSQGIMGSYVKRMATLVDGSIAVVTVAILLFANNNYLHERKKNFIKLAVIGSVIAVIAFSMSRSRLILVLGLVIVKLFFIKDNGSKRKSKSIIYVLIGIVVLYVLSQTSLGSVLFGSMTARFESGMESKGRNDEILFALTLFANNPIWGSGWSDFMYTDYLTQEVGYNQHSMYVALLARGGIVFALVVLVSLYLVLKNTMKIYKYNKLPAVLMVLFLMLAYGNAGFFNYTICGFFIPIITILQQENKRFRNGIDVYHK